MPQSLSKIVLHIVFSTKYRAPLLFPEFEDEMYKYLAAACKALKSHAIKVGGAEDHIHRVCNFFCVKFFLRKIKLKFKVLRRSRNGQVTIRPGCRPFVVGAW